MCPTVCVYVCVCVSVCQNLNMNPFLKGHDKEENLVNADTLKTDSVTDQD